MATPVQIPAGLLVPTMIPLDAKNYFKTLIELGDLGESSSNAYKYYAGMIAFCLEDKNLYIWMERPIGYIVDGVLDGDFIYPTGLVVDDINYGNKHYNFFNYLEYWLSENNQAISLQFRYRPGFYKLMDNDETPLSGGFLPDEFIFTSNLPYKMKGKINLFYTEDYEEIEYLIRLADVVGTLLEEWSGSVILPPYPGEFELPVVELPELILGQIYNISIRTNRIGQTSYLHAAQQFRIVSE